MTSLILRSASAVLIPLQVVFSLFLLLRGHNDPGGGFAGALVIATALALHAVAFTPQETRRVLRVQPVTLVGIGLFAALVSGVLGLTLGDPFLTGHWLDAAPLGVKLGTPLLFDLGVYLLVVGVAAGVLLTLMEGR